MTTELDGIAVQTETLAPDIVSQIASSAMSLDQGERDTRANIELLARSGILGLGAPATMTTHCRRWPRRSPNWRVIACRRPFRYGRIA